MTVEKIVGNKKR